MKRYINSLYPFGTRKNCHKNGNNPLLFQFIRKAIEWTVIIIEEFHSSTKLTLTPWLMEPGSSMPHSQGLSNNSYPEPNQPNSPH